MGLRPCKECGQQISTDAKVCPHCGKKLGTSAGVGCLAIIFAIFLIALIGGVASHSPSAGDSSSYSPAVSPKELTLKQVKLDFKARKEGFGNVMEADFTISNNSAHSIKDIEISCDHYAKSGTKIDSNTRTIYDTVKAHSKRTFRNFNMGLIHSQAASTSCSVSDLQIQ